MFCSQCGQMNGDDARFCSQCGARLATPAPNSTLSGGQTLTPPASPMPPSTLPDDPQAQSPADQSPTPMSDTIGGGRTLTSPTPAAFGEGVDAGRAVFSGLNIGDNVAGRFKIVAELGRGGMGIVYKVLDLKLGEDRAMKIIPAHMIARVDILERFRQEVITSQRLAHPHIVRVYEYDEDEALGLHFFTMELVEGQTLRVWMNQRRQADQRVSLAEFHMILNALCDALEYAHRYTVHRDIKPENILVSEDLATLKLTDFGIARALRAQQVYVTAGAIGTPHYMAPEQETGPNIDLRADIYALGVLSYELLAGRLPRVAYKPISSLRSDVPAVLDGVITRAMVEEPADRWKSVSALAYAIQHPDAPDVGEAAAFAPRRPDASPEQRVMRHLAEWFRQREAKSASTSEIRALHTVWTREHPERLSGIASSVLLSLADRARRQAADDLAWEAACKEGTEEAIERYINTEGLGSYRETASQKLIELIENREATEQEDERLWEEARKADIPEVYELYCHTSPIRRHEEAARKRIEELHEVWLWQQATKADTIEAYEQYLRDSVLKQYENDVRKRLYELHYPDEEKEWNNLKLSPSILAARCFQDRYPESTHRHEVQEALDRLLLSRDRRRVLIISFTLLLIFCIGLLAYVFYEYLVVVAAFMSTLILGGLIYYAAKIVFRDETNEPKAEPEEAEKHGLGKMIVRSSVTVLHTTLDPELVLDLGGGTTMCLVLVLPGEFMMGSLDSEAGRDANEGPQHKVTISKPFYIGKYPVTQEQWKAIMGYSPFRYEGGEHPVESVTWDDCQQFCQVLSNKSDKSICLPTEAEWEYACRAGTGTAYSYGDAVENLKEYGWYDENSEGKTRPVGQKQPNAWGLYDMHGNVWEWCRDVWHASYESAPTVGSAWVEDGDTTVHMLRGGSWGNIARYCRSACRLKGAPNGRLPYVGFRVVCVPEASFQQPDDVTKIDRFRELSLWQRAKENDTVEAYESYLQESVLKQYEQQARKRLYVLRYPDEEQTWGSLIYLPGIHKAQAFLDRYPESDHRVDAQKMLNRLLVSRGRRRVFGVMFLYVVFVLVLWLVYSLAITMSTQPRKHQFAAANTPKSPEYEVLYLGKGVKMELVQILADEFEMGSNDGSDDEKPIHRVKIGMPFYMGKYEVTQAQWQAVMDSNPSNFKGDGSLPVENVSWNDCQDFCSKLSEKTGTTVRLPTEAEWEYACRAGNRTRFGFVDSDGQLGEYAWYESNSGSKTHPVGQKKPNAFGLYDMHGNVWEWCQDWYGSYLSENQTDPTGASNGRIRVLRGGSLCYFPSYCRSAFRFRGVPYYRDRDIGLRVVALSQ